MKSWQQNCHPCTYCMLHTYCKKLLLRQMLSASCGAATGSATRDIPSRCRVLCCRGLLKLGRGVAADVPQSSARLEGPSWMCTTTQSTQYEQTAWNLPVDGHTCLASTYHRQRAAGFFRIAHWFIGGAPHATSLSPVRRSMPLEGSLFWYSWLNFSSSRQSFSLSTSLVKLQFLFDTGRAVETAFRLIIF